MNRARKMSFMLIEPLVVIVSIAILVPAMARAREEAQRINCAGNLKSIDLALLIYSVITPGSCLTTPPTTRASTC